MFAAVDSLDQYPGSAYGLFDTGQQLHADDATETSKIPTVSKAVAAAGTFWHKDSPMLVLGVILAITLGAGFTATGRAGKAKATLDLGVTK